MPLIKQPIHPECRFTIVVPVYRERWHRLIRQIKSLDRQVDLSPEEYEVIYVINNSPEAPADVRQVNRAALVAVRAAAEMNGRRIFALDAFSGKNAIPGCNVARARNLGLYEAISRYESLNRKGWIIHTDADTYFPGTDYFARLKRFLDNNPDACAFNAGLEMEFSPDQPDNKEMPDLKARVTRMAQMVGWMYYGEAIEKGLRDGSFSGFMKLCGAHMIADTEVSKGIQGIPDRGATEDNAFGESITEWAKQNQRSFPYIRDQLTLVSAARDSDRTPASFYQRLKDLDLSITPRGPDLCALMSGQPVREVDINQQSISEVREQLKKKPEGHRTLKEFDLFLGRLLN